MPDLMIPEGEELNFHEELLHDSETIKNIMILPDQDPAGWREFWQEKNALDYCYRMVYCDGCGYFVGDVSYRRTAEDKADLWMMISGDLRNAGYGAAVLKLIAEVAVKNGIYKFRIRMKKGHPNMEFFRKRGFTESRTEGDIVELEAKTKKLAGIKCCEGCCSVHKKQEKEVEG